MKIIYILSILFACFALPSCRQSAVCQDTEKVSPSSSPECTHKQLYDFNTYHLSGEEQIFDKGCGSYVLHCRGSIGDEKGETRSYYLRGIGFPLQVKGGKYFVSAGHVFDMEEKMLTNGYDPEKVTLLPPEYSVDYSGRRYDLVRIDDGSIDLAVFTTVNGQGDISGERYGCGNSDDLRPGTSVLSWGMPLMENFELSIGTVSALAAPRSLIQSSFPEAASEDFFVTSMPTIFGCSGAPVYAFRGGEPEIVGMVVAGYININRSVVYKINSILRDSGIR